MNKLSAPYALKKLIIEYANEAEYSGFKYDGPLTTEKEIDDAMIYMHDQIGCDAQQDVMEGDYTTNIPSEFCRHCETESVAVKDNYGNYIGFARFFIGGKHFDAYSYYECSIDGAYFLSCEEKQVLTTQRVWSKIEQ